MRLKVHPGMCEGHGVCRRFAPAVYDLDDEGYLGLRLLQVPPELEEQARFGARRARPGPSPDRRAAGGSDASVRGGGLS
jgi:ferredoxin